MPLNARVMVVKPANYLLFTTITCAFTYGLNYYSSLPSKHIHIGPPEGMLVEGLLVPPIPATPGRTQPTPSASRSVGAELTGELTSILGT